MPSLSIDIKARLAEFQDGINRVERDTGRMVKGLDSAFAGLRSTVGLLAGAAVFGNLISSFRETANSLDDLAKASQAAGVTVEQLSALRYAADFAGVSSSELDTALGRLSRSLFDAQKGTGEAADAFARLRLDPSQFSNADQALKALADSFSLLPDGAQKTALAMQLLGRSGASLIPLLNSGSQGLKEMRVEAEGLGLVFGTQAARDAEVFNDQLTRLGKELDGVKVSLAGPLLSDFTKFLDLLKINRAEAGDGILGTLAAINLTAAEVLYLPDFEDQISSLEEKIVEATAVAKKFEEQLAKDPPRLQASAITAGLERANKIIDETQKKIVELNRKSLRDFPGFAPIGGALPKADATIAQEEKKARVTVKRISDGERLIQQLQSQINATRDLTAAQQLEVDIFQKKISLTGAQADIARSLAREIDERKELNSAIQAEQELRSLIERAQDREVERGLRVQEALKSDAERMKDLADPTREVLRQIQAVQEALSAGLITQDVADKNIEQIANLASKIDDVKKPTEEVKTAFSEMQFAFESGFEKAIFAGEKLSDVLKQLVIDMAKLIIRQQVLTPLFDTILGATKSFGGQQSGGGVAGAQGIGQADAFASLFGGLSQAASGGSQTVVNVASGVSPAQTQAAVQAGMSQVRGGILDSRARGGAYAGT